MLSQIVGARGEGGRGLVVVPIAPLHNMLRRRLRSLQARFRPTTIGGRSETLESVLDEIAATSIKFSYAKEHGFCNLDDSTHFMLCLEDNKTAHGQCRILLDCFSSLSHTTCSHVVLRVSFLCN